MLTRSQIQAMVAAEFKSRAGSSSGGKAEDQRSAGNTGGGDDKKPKQQKQKKKYDKRLVRCHNCNKLEHLKSE